MQIVPLRYAPDEDTAWLANPGACTVVNGYAPMNRGTYGSVGTGYWIGSSTSITGSDVVHAQLFRKVDGTTRMFTFRKQNIDEYSNTATRTNQGSGYSASTTDWTAAAFGDYIIATNYLDAVQVSTGSTFGTLSGSPPKAKLVAANDLFVMLANYDDGTAYADGWWCSALANPTSWTASAATQAANGRIWGPPGPIRALIAFKRSFVVFKDNSTHILNYVGPPNIWTVSTISDRIGCPSSHGVVQLGDKLYWYHSSGFYSFDGSNIVDIGKSVINKFNQYVGYTPASDLGLTLTAYNGPSKVQAVADDIENLVVFNTVAFASTTLYHWSFAFNTLTGKWGRWMEHSGAVANDVRYIAGTTADAQTFKSSSSARLQYIHVGSSSSACRYFAYPAAISSIYAEYTNPYIDTGMIGDYDAVRTVSNVYVRDLQNAQDFAVQLTGWQAENVSTISTVTASENSELARFDAVSPGKFHRVRLTQTSSTASEIAGIGLQYAEKQPGKR